MAVGLRDEDSAPFSFCVSLSLDKLVISVTLGVPSDVIFLAFQGPSSIVISIREHRPLDSEFTLVDNLGCLENLRV